MIRTAAAATQITCDCGVCNGKTVLVPTRTIDSIPATKRRTAKQRAALNHNFVAQARILGYPVA